MRILITGGAGCLGSNLVEHWLPQGHDILAIDNFATGKREVLPPVPDYLTLGSDGLSVQVAREPRRAEVPVTCDVALVVEYYAR